jgi:hypothetical protein
MLNAHHDLNLVQSIARQVSPNVSQLTADISLQLNAGMEGARSDDSGTLKPRILGWLAEDPTLSSTSTLTSSASKATRGLSDPVIGPHLLPLEFKNNAEFPEYVPLIFICSH